jgi:hypothetical protein
MVEVSAIGLFSGGLDSILACHLIKAQGIRVIPVKFVTPFFDYHLLADQDAYRQEIMEKFSLSVELVDISSGYIDLLRKPAHGFGSNFNPCIDCKIFMMSRARELMDKLGASFIFSGEVLGQRPMSQRRDSLRVIERDSGCEDILLRPLCAKRLNPIRAEREGLVDRQQLLDFTGRGRRPQMELAEKFALREYPNAGGGCVLTDPNLASRIKKLYNGVFDSLSAEKFTVKDINLLLFGRHFCLPGGFWLVLGRNKEENEQLLDLKQDGDIVLLMPKRPGPAGLLRFAPDYAGINNHDELLMRAAGLVVRYGKKVGGIVLPGQVLIELGGMEISMEAAPLADQVFADWVL